MRGIRVATDRQNNVLATSESYTHYGPVQFPGIFQCALAKHDSVGALIWVNTMDHAIVSDVSTDTGGNVYLTGSTEHTGYFNGTTGSITVNTAGARRNGFAANYSPSGNVIWVQTFGHLPFN